ncbi:MAG: hypothetical protein PHD54_01175 [Desulfuromonadaceae bacterium]|nr:hypothetical protein [Desulfuromonadaceae bacterium]
MLFFSRLKMYLSLFCLAICSAASSALVYGGDITVTYRNGVTQSMQLQQDPGYIKNIEIGGSDGAMPATLSGPGMPVTIYWHMADDADLYLNGRPLRRYEPSFKSRGDEAPLPAFSASAVLRQGDVFTVGGRRGGSFGFMLIAVDINGQVVFKSDQMAWKVYDPGENLNWFMPEVAKHSPVFPVTVQQDPWYPQKALNSKYGNTALSIWSSPDQRFAYLVGVVRFLR